MTQSVGIQRSYSPERAGVEEALRFLMKLPRVLDAKHLRITQVLSETAEDSGYLGVPTGSPVTRTKSANVLSYGAQIDWAVSSGGRAPAF